MRIIDSERGLGEGADAPHLDVRLGRTPAGALHLQLSEQEACTPRISPVSPLELADRWGVTGLAYAHGLEVTEYDLAAEALGVLPTVELSRGGLAYGGATARGLLTTKDTKALYQPLSARGSVIDHGLYERLWREEVQIQRPWVDILDALIAGDWYVDPVSKDPAHEAQAIWCEEALLDIEGGWSNFLTGALYSLIAGFALFEKVYDADTLAIKRLAFRHPKQVREWITDERATRLVGVKLASPVTGGQDVTLPAHHVLLLSHNAFGLDFEGNSPLRPIAPFAAAKSLFVRLEPLAGEKFGAPWIVLTSDPAKGQADAVSAVDVLDQMTAEDLVVISLPDGHQLQIMSPTGTMPDFTPVKRYCDEQIAMALRGESSLLGQGGKGSYALAEVIDGKRVGAVPSYARRICEAINGSRGTPQHGVIRDMIDARFGAPRDGRYPQLRYVVDRSARPETWLADVATAVSARLIDWTSSDQTMLREHLGLEV